MQISQAHLEGHLHAHILPFQKMSLINLNMRLLPLFSWQVFVVEKGVLYFFNTVFFFRSHLIHGFLGEYLSLRNSVVLKNLLRNEVFDRMGDLVYSWLLCFFLYYLVLVEEILVQLAFLKVALLIHAEGRFDFFSIWRVKTIFIDSHGKLAFVKHNLLEAFLTHLFEL